MSPQIISTVMILLIGLASGVKHVQFEERCGPEDTCDKNNGLYCDTEKKICLCSEAASWVKDFGDDFHCRVQVGKKCGRSLTSPKCEQGLHCEPVKEGDLSETICKCPDGEVCLSGKSNKEGGSDASRTGPGVNLLMITFIGSLLVVLAHF